MKYLRTHLIRKSTWCVGRGKPDDYEDYEDYEDYVKHHSLASYDIKQIKFIFESLLIYPGSHKDNTKLLIPFQTYV